jgi:D-arginine dehydrogenase
MSTPVSADILIIGGGMAGASMGYFLAPHARVILLERESQPGYHTTGRSAAMYLESYGPPQVRALTLASHAFFSAPPAGVFDAPILTPRAYLVIAEPGEPQALDRHEMILREISILFRRLAPEACRELFPILRSDRISGGVLELSSADMDVNTLLQGFLRGLRRAGGRVVCNAVVMALDRASEEWTAHTPAGVFRAPIVVNAAGAWGDAVARVAGVAPIGLQPRRRTAFTFLPPAGLDPRTWPVLMDAGESFYLKPDAGMLLGSPANADPVDAHDVRPEDLDIAMAIERIEQMTMAVVRRPAYSWAGLRTFSPDGGLVGGYAADAPGFFWCVGQGGYGIQTAAAMGEACAAITLRQIIPEHLARFGVTEARLSPLRLSAQAASI